MQHQLVINKNKRKTEYFLSYPIFCPLCHTYQIKQIKMKYMQLSIYFSVVFQMHIAAKQKSSTRGDFTNKQISISRELLHVAARGWRGGFATSMMINVCKVLLMLSDFINSVFFLHTHTQLLAKRHSPEWSIRVHILFFTHFSILSPSQDPHKPQKTINYLVYLTSKSLTAIYCFFFCLTILGL